LFAFILSFGFILSFAFSGFSANFFVILLEGSKIFSCLREFSFFHTFSDVPVDESTLGIHKIELVINTRKSFGNSSGVGDHAYSSLNTSQITTWNDCRRLVVDAALEASWAPIDELHSALSLDSGNSRVDILGDNVTSEHHAAGHVLAVTRIALSKHIRGLEDGVGNFTDRELFVVCLLSRDDGSIRGKHKVDTRVWHKVGLELGEIDVQSTIEAERSRQRRHNLSNETVEVGVSGSLDIQVAAAHVVESFVVKTEGAVGVLQEGVGGEDVVVWLDDGSGDLRSRSHGERELGLAAIVDRETFKEERAEARSGASTSSVEDHESLETRAVVGELADAVENEVNHFLADGVVATSVVVGSVFLAGDELLGVVQLAVGASSDLVADTWLQVDHHSAGDVLASSGLAEESVERVIASADSLVRGHLTIGLDTVL